MSLRAFYFVGALTIALMLAISAYAWIALPDDARLPVHWGVDGEPDRYGSKVEALLLSPAIALGIVLLLAVLPRIEPRRANLHGNIMANRYSRR